MLPCDMISSESEKRGCCGFLRWKSQNFGKLLVILKARLQLQHLEPIDNARNIHHRWNGLGLQDET